MKSALAASLIATLMASCASTSWPASADPAVMSDTPDYFLVLDRATGARSEPSGAACRSPLVDPRDGTTLTLIRSIPGIGDYRPDTPRYGLGTKQLLRIDCSNGRPVGVTDGGPDRGE